MTVIELLEKLKEMLPHYANYKVRVTHFSEEGTYSLDITDDVCIHKNLELVEFVEFMEM